MTLPAGIELQSNILAPAIALVLWSFVMLTWMYATRIPAIFKLKIKYDANQPNEVFTNKMPPTVRWKADNYNNLMETPTIFYAVVITLAILHQGNSTNVTLAWYVLLRVVHSIWQVLLNLVTIRFILFIASNVVLFILTLRSAFVLFL